MSWETWQDTGAQNQKFDDLDDEQEEGGLLDGCDDWEEWSEKSEEEQADAAPGDWDADGAPAEAKPKPKPKPKAKKVKKKKDTEEDLDAETKKRRELMRQKVTDFEAASTLFGDEISKKVPVSKLAVKTAEEVRYLAGAIAEVLSTFSEHSKYVDFLIAIIKEVKELQKHEPLERLSKKVTVLHNERLKEEKMGLTGDDSAAAAAKKKKEKKKDKAKQDDMDAALDSRNRQYVDDEFDFM